jgi:RNA polymerase sigma-70 factor (ECF subfamily)
MVAGLRNDDPVAVRAFYERFAGAVFAIAYRTLGNRELAADAVQLTFIKAWLAAKDIDDSRAVSPWLYTVARRAAVDVFRAESRSPRRVDVEPDLLGTAPPSMEACWEVFQVRAALDALPAPAHEIVYAQHYLGLSYRQIAERLGVPVGTVKSRSFRAHRRLAELLRHLEPDIEGKTPTRQPGRRCGTRVIAVDRGSGQGTFE